MLLRLDRRNYDNAGVSIDWHLRETWRRLRMLRESERSAVGFAEQTITGWRTSLTLKWTPLPTRASGDFMNTDTDKPSELPALLAAARLSAPGWLIARFRAGPGWSRLLLTVLLPPHFRSAGTILIEQQEMPQELVRSTVTSYADERVQVISKRVMTTETLFGIIRRYDLYPGGARQQHTREALLAQMRKDIGLQA